MDKTMKRIYSAFFALLLMTGAVMVAEAQQQSDFEIQQNFRTEYAELANLIDNATSSDDLREISGRVSRLQSDYGRHSGLLDAALYPETYSSRMQDLQARLRAAENNIASIEQLNQRVEQLNNELNSFRDQLAEMDQRAEDLQRQIRESQASERNVSALARRYRESLQQRDQFVTEFLTNLLKRYESVDASTARELDDAMAQLDENPIDLLKTIISEYLNYTNQATGLDASDYLSMKAQQGYFNEWWREFGNRLTEVFDPESPVQSRQEVTDLLSNWNSSIDNKLWTALNSAFSNAGVDLGQFNDSRSFYSALESFVASAVQAAQESNSEANMERFNNFSEFWNNTVKAQWGELLTTGNILTHQQIAQIDRQLDDWSQAAVPTSNLMLVLFLIALAVIIGLVVALVRKK